MTLKPVSIAALALAAACGANAMGNADGVPETRWVTSWYAAPQAVWGPGFVLPTNVPLWLDNQALRETVRLSAGGRAVRVVLSNRYGSTPVRLGEVSIGLLDGPVPAQRLTFSGHADVSIPPGAAVTSDPLQWTVPPLARLWVGTHVPERTRVESFHWGALQTIEVDQGKRTGALRDTAAHIDGRLFLNAVLVDTGGEGRTVVALGDSITDGNGSTPNTDRRWPDFLAQRLASHGIGVANAGISGARLLRDGMGQNALARFDRDVLAQPGVSDVIVLLGINDIGWPGSPFAPAERAVTLDELTAGYRQLAAAAHLRNVRITVGTLPPFEGALAGTPYEGHYSPAKEALRARLNDWIRTAGIFDAVVDFDAVLRDPAHPRRLRAGYDSGDHLHPGDAGYRKMAEAIDVAGLVAGARDATSRSGDKP
jgi:lysophospholipase L1-like esterase